MLQQHIGMVETLFMSIEKSLICFKIQATSFLGLIITEHGFK